jgi:GTP-binding protein
LIHLLDAGSEDVVSDLKVVEAELKAYGHGLESRPRLVVLNKIDVVPPEDLEALAESVSQTCGGHRPLLISAATSKGLEILLVEVWKQLKQLDEAQQIQDNSARESLSSEFPSSASQLANQSS